MVLCNLPVPGRPTIWISVGQGPTALAVGAGGVVWTFLLSSVISFLSPSLWETVRYGLKYCLKGPLNPKPTNLPTYNLDTVGQGLTALAVGTGGGVWTFLLSYLFLSSFSLFLREWWWSDGAKVLGKLPVPGRPTILITVGQGPIAPAVGAGGGCLDIFTLIYPFSSLSASIWETGVVGWCEGAG